MSLSIRLDDEKDKNVVVWAIHSRIMMMIMGQVHIVYVPRTNNEEEKKAREQEVCMMMLSEYR